MNTKKRVIALGFFDGVHLGHAALMKKTVERAKELSATPSAFTFDPHPQTLISGRSVPLLSAPHDRAELMHRYYAIEDVIVEPFTKARMEQPWDAFVRDTLVGDLGATHLVCGHDYHFGHKGKGDPEKLSTICKELGIGLDVISKVELGDTLVSSTYIRGLVTEGDMEAANRFLGHPHTLSDVVSHGKKLGSSLGFPTVNMNLKPHVLAPALGVYATKVFLENGNSHIAVTNVGRRPTVDDGDHVNVEGFILDFSGDLYGQNIRMEFFKFIRPEKKFSSLEELRDEIMKNAQQTRDYFA